MKNPKKEGIFAIVISIIGIIIAYIITSLLGIKNIVLFESTLGTYMLTYETLIWFAIVLPAAFIYEYKQKKEQDI